MTSADETLLAFDFGLKRIGVAVGETRLAEARALVTVASEPSAARFMAIDKLIQDWQPARLLVGRPLNDDGTPHALTARCERFANQLQGRFRLPVERVDERYSSLDADSSLRATGMSWQDRKARLDAEAARIILQSWFHSAHERVTHVPA